MADGDARAAFAGRRRAVDRALRRLARPDRAVVVVLPAGQADALRRGLAAERVQLRDLDDGLAELVVLAPGEPPRLLGWSPLRRPRRGRGR